MSVVHHPRSAVSETGELPADGPQTFAEALDIIDRQNRKLNGAWSQIGKLERQLAEQQAKEPEARQIMEVLTFWRDRCKPKAKIVVGSERWLKVRARLREKDAQTKQPCYTVEDLKRAVEGARRSAYHVENGYLDAKTIFRDSGTVDDHLARADSEALFEAEVERVVRAVREEIRARRVARGETPAGTPLEGAA